MRLSVPRGHSRLRRLLGAVALLVGAAAPAAYSGAPAQAAGACTPQGVTVVVDFGALGGGVQRGCASSPGKAAALFAAAGHRLGRVQAQPSAVCSVDAKPATPCPQMPPANAYWGLFWTDGSTAKWTYASLGVDSLSVPAGGSVGFAWQSAAGNRAPGLAPAVTTVATPAAKPTKAAKPKSAKPGAKGATKAATKAATKLASASASSAAPTSTVGPSVSAGVSPTSVASPPADAKKKRANAGASTAGSVLPSTPAASPTSTDSPTISADSAPISAKSGDGGLPGWVAPLAVLVVLAAGGGVAVARRRVR